MSAAFVSKSGVGRGHVAGQPLGPEVSFAPVLPPPCRPPRFGEGLDPARVSASCHPAAVGAWRPVLGRVRVRSTSTAHVPGYWLVKPSTPCSSPLVGGAYCSPYVLRKSFAFFVVFITFWSRMVFPLQNEILIGSSWSFFTIPGGKAFFRYKSIIGSSLSRSLSRRPRDGGGARVQHPE